MGLIMPSLQRSETATVKGTPECYFIIVKFYSERFGEINLFQMLHRTYCHAEDKTLYLLLLHWDCPSREELQEPGEKKYMITLKTETKISSSSIPLNKQTKNHKA